MSLPLTGRRIVIPETRELDLLARMLEERGAETLRCPLVLILDAPDPAPIEAWLSRFNAGGMTDLVLMTGEGLRRLRGVASRSGIEPAFLARLAEVRKITRGPKPARALREIDLTPDISAASPTMDGVIDSLKSEPLAGRRFGVQLYPESNPALLAFLAEQGAATDPVEPYIYTSKAEDGRVIEMIDAMAAGNADAIAFTSSPQVKRLFDVAKEAGREAQLRAGLARVAVAAVGPIVAEALRRKNIRIDIEPKGNFFMKPLVNLLADRFGPG